MRQINAVLRVVNHAGLVERALATAIGRQIAQDEVRFAVIPDGLQKLLLHGVFREVALYKCHLSIHGFHRQDIHRDDPHAILQQHLRPAAWGCTELQRYLPTSQKGWACFRIDLFQLVHSARPIALALCLQNVLVESLAIHPPVGERALEETQHNIFSDLIVFTAAAYFIMCGEVSRARGVCHSVYGIYRGAARTGTGSVSKGLACSTVSRNLVGVAEGCCVGLFVVYSYN